MLKSLGEYKKRAEDNKPSGLLRHIPKKLHLPRTFRQKILQRSNFSNKIQNKISIFQSPGGKTVNFNHVYLTKYFLRNKLIYLAASHDSFVRHLIKNFKNLWNF